jgi:hypothetical protein
VTKRARGFEPENPTSDEELIPTYDASLQKLEAFRYSNSSSIVDHHETFTAYPKPVVDSKSAISPNKGSEQTASLADEEPWLLDSDVSDSFQFPELGNNGNSTGPETQQFGTGITDWNPLSSETSFLDAKPRLSTVEMAPHRSSPPDNDPFSDLEDADFSDLDPPAQPSLPHRPQPSSPALPPPPPPVQPRKPIVRPPFPGPVRARSLVHGVSATTVLRTCFRVGEALRAGSRAVRAADDVVIELFARVASSSREGGARTPSSYSSSASRMASSSPVRSDRQDFRFADLFHDRPPFLKGVYDLWKGSELWDADSREFLDIGGEPMLCRCVGKMKRDGQGLLLTVYSVRRVSWDDVDHAKAIVCGSE